MFPAGFHGELAALATIGVALVGMLVAAVWAMFAQLDSGDTRAKRVCRSVAGPLACIAYAFFLVFAVDKRWLNGPSGILLDQLF